MELPSMPAGESLLPAGEMVQLRSRLRRMTQRHDLASVIACAFDHRTRMLPFIYTDLKMVPAGVRAIGAALADIGCEKTRIVLQQWNKNFRPSQMRLDGRIPDLFLVSSMHLHSEACDKLIQDACRIEPDRRPLIIAGGPRMMYEPWQVFGSDPSQPWGADVAVTGEEYVFLSLLEVLLNHRARGESMRSAFLRARDQGALDGIRGLVYSRSSCDDGPAEELVDTGIQRLLGDLDELPHPVLGYGMLEPPGRGEALSASALPASRVRKHCIVSSLVLTLGCRFRCSYCPIPAYNQRQYRQKSGERIADEMRRIAESFGIVTFFGADDNFFNDPPRTLQIVETLARKAREHGRPFCKIRWGTEATVHDTLRMRDHLRVVRESGLTALWLGVEDLTGSLVKKGQDKNKTLEAFRALRENGIQPIPMMMHHDSQPLVTLRSNYGLLNQLQTLRSAGALYTQITMLTPSPGSKSYESMYESGQMIHKVDGRAVAPHIIDGNYVVASEAKRPWAKQLNLLAAYAFFYNPLRMFVALFASRSRIAYSTNDTRPLEETRKYSFSRRIRRRMYLAARAHLVDAGVQLFGMYGLIHTARRTLAWAWHLRRGRIERCTEVPVSRIPMRGVDGGAADHAIPGTPQSSGGSRIRLVQLGRKRAA